MSGSNSKSNFGLLRNHKSDATSNQVSSFSLVNKIVNYNDKFDINMYHGPETTTRKFRHFMLTYIKKQPYGSFFDNFVAQHLCLCQEKPGRFHAICFAFFKWEPHRLFHTHFDPTYISWIPNVEFPIPIYEEEAYEMIVEKEGSTYDDVFNPDHYVSIPCWYVFVDKFYWDDNNKYPVPLRHQIYRPYWLAIRHAMFTILSEYDFTPTCPAIVRLCKFCDNYRDRINIFPYDDETFQQSYHWSDELPRRDFDPDSYDYFDFLYSTPITTIRFLFDPTQLWDHTEHSVENQEFIQQVIRQNLAIAQEEMFSAAKNFASNIGATASNLANITALTNEFAENLRHKGALFQDAFGAGITQAQDGNISNIILDQITDFGDGPVFNIAYAIGQFTAWWADAVVTFQELPQEGESYYAWLNHFEHNPAVQIIITLTNLHDELAYLPTHLSLLKIVKYILTLCGLPTTVVYLIVRHLLSFIMQEVDSAQNHLGGDLPRATQEMDLSKITEAFAKNGLLDKLTKLAVQWNTLYKSFTNLAKFVSSIGEFLYSVVTYFYPDCAVSELEDQLQKDLEEFMRIVEHFSLPENGWMLGSIEHRKVVLNQKQKVSKFNKFFSQYTIKHPNSTTFQMYRSCIAKYDLLYKEAIHRGGYESGNFRCEPFCVSIVGDETNIGKSLLSTHLTGLLTEQYCKEFHVSEAERSVYSWNPALKHADGYIGQLVVKMDDIFTTLQNSGCSGAAQFNQMMTCEPYILSMADTKDKGKHFVSRFIITTSNVMYPRLPDVPVARAIWRRRDLLVEAKRIPERDMEIGSYEHNKYRIRDSCNDQVFGEWMTWAEMEKIILKAAAEKTKKQNLLREHFLQENKVLEGYQDEHQILEELLRENPSHYEASSFGLRCVNSACQCLSLYATEAVTYFKSINVREPVYSFSQKIMDKVKSFIDALQPYKNLLKIGALFSCVAGVYYVARKVLGLGKAPFAEEEAIIEVDGWQSLLSQEGRVRPDGLSKPQYRQEIAHKICATKNSESKSTQYKIHKVNGKQLLLETKPKPTPKPRTIKTSGDPKADLITLENPYKPTSSTIRRNPPMIQNLEVETNTSLTLLDFKKKIVGIEDQEKVRDFFSELNGNCVYCAELERNSKWYETTQMCDRCNKIDNYLDELHAVQESQNSEEALRIIMKHTYILQSKKGNLHGTHVIGQCILTNYHFFAPLEENDDIILLNAVDGTKRTSKFSEAYLARLKDSDICLYFFSGLHPCPKSVLKQFASLQDFEQKNYFDNITCCAYSFKMQMWLRHDIKHAEARSVIISRQVGGDYVEKDTFVFAGTPDSGRCGALYVTHDAFKSNVIGMHVAYVQSTSESVLRVVNRETVSFLASELYTRIGEDFPGVCLVEDEEIPDFISFAEEENLHLIGPNMPFIGYLDPKLAKYQPKKHQKERSPAYGQLYQPRKDLSVLSTFDKRVAEEYRGMDIELKGLTKYTVPYTEYPYEILKEMTEFHYARFRNFNYTERPMVRDENIVINGDFNEDGSRKDCCVGLNMQTSPGFGFKAPIGAGGGKEWLFNSKQVGVNRIERSMKEDLASKCHDIESKMKRGIAPACFAVNCLKDETRPLEKILKGSTRNFVMYGVDWSIVMKKYFYDFIVAMTRSHGISTAKVGIDPTGLDWDRMMRQFLEYSSKNGFDGDYAAYDGATFMQQLLPICAAINRWYNDGIENARIRYICFLRLMYCYVVTGNLCHMKKQGQTSGNVLTTPLNCVVNDQLFYYAFRVAWLIKRNETGEDPYKYSYHNMSDYVRSAFYGDDNAHSVKDEIAEWFNPKIISMVINSTGFTITDAAKTGVLEWKNVVDMEFLKMKTTNFNGFWIARLQKASIEEMSNWIRKNYVDTPLMKLRANFETMLRYAFPWGEEYYNDMYGKVNTFLFNHRQPLLNLPYKFQLDRFSSDKLGVKKSTWQGLIKNFVLPSAIVVRTEEADDDETLSYFSLQDDIETT